MNKIGGKKNYLSNYKIKNNDFINDDGNNDDGLINDNVHDDAYFIEVDKPYEGYGITPKPLEKTSRVG